MKNKTDAIVALAKEKSTKREKEVLEAIHQMQRAGDKISVYSVSKATRASKTFIYRHETILAAIRDSSCNSVPPSVESQQVRLKILQSRIADLEAENEKLKATNGDSYKAKYEKLRNENTELKKQLKAVYEY